MSNINGLTKTEIEAFFDCCIKANNQQIEAMRQYLNKEIAKRETIAKEVLLTVKA